MSDVALLDTAVVAHQLGGLRLGPRHHQKALTLWPLLPLQPPEEELPEPLLVETALEDGVAGVSEPGDPTERFVRVDNRASLPLLVLAGEPLGAPSTGAHAATSVVVPPRARLEVPVTSHDTSHGRMQRELARQLREVSALPGQRGLVVSMGERVLGLELLGGPDGFARALPRLAASLWLRALEVAFRCGSGATPHRPRFEAPEPFVDALVRTPARAVPVPGVGRGLELEADGVVARALVVQGRLAHLTARPLDSLHPTERSLRRRSVA